eukprot:6723592-Prorocentrum_lima.AAC.1
MLNMYRFAASQLECALCALPPGGQEPSAAETPLLLESVHPSGIGGAFCVWVFAKGKVGEKVSPLTSTS